MDLAEALEQLPKVELHCHIEGTVRPLTVLELATRKGVALPTTDLDRLYRYGSLDEFLAVFWLVQSSFDAPVLRARGAHRRRRHGLDRESGSIPARSPPPTARRDPPGCA